MERGIVDADRILVVCTDNYVGKANAGEGGVGYERMIITKKIVEDQGNNKFIPIVRQTLLEDKTPKFLQGRVYVDFTDDSQFDTKFEELLHERLLVPSLQRPSVPHIESLRVTNLPRVTRYRIKTTQTINCFFRPKRQWKIDTV